MQSMESCPRRLDTMESLTEDCQGEWKNTSNLSINSDIFIIGYLANIKCLKSTRSNGFKRGFLHFWWLCFRSKKGFTFLIKICWYNISKKVKVFFLFCLILFFSVKSLDYCFPNFFCWFYIIVYIILTNKTVWFTGEISSISVTAGGI